MTDPEKKTKILRRKLSKRNKSMRRKKSLRRNKSLRRRGGGGKTGTKQRGSETVTVTSLTPRRDPDSKAKEVEKKQQEKERADKLEMQAQYPGLTEKERENIRKKRQRLLDLREEEKQRRADELDEKQKQELEQKQKEEEKKAEEKKLKEREIRQKKLEQIKRRKVEEEKEKKALEIMKEAEMMKQTYAQDSEKPILRLKAHEGPISLEDKKRRNKVVKERNKVVKEMNKAIKEEEEALALKELNEAVNVPLPLDNDSDDILDKMSDKEKIIIEETRTKEKLEKAKEEKLKKELEIMKEAEMMEQTYAQESEKPILRLNAHEGPISLEDKKRRNKVVKEAEKALALKELEEATNVPLPFDVNEEIRDFFHKDISHTIANNIQRITEADHAVVYPGIIDEGFKIKTVAGIEKAISKAQKKYEKLIRDTDTNHHENAIETIKDILSDFKTQIKNIQRQDYLIETHALQRIITGELLKISEYLQKVRIRLEDKMSLDIVEKELEKLMSIIDRKIIPFLNKCITRIRKKSGKSDNDSGVDRLIKLRNKLVEIKAEAILLGGFGPDEEELKAAYEAKIAADSHRPPGDTRAIEELQASIESDMEGNLGLTGYTPAASQRVLHDQIEDTIEDPHSETEENLGLTEGEVSEIEESIIDGNFEIGGEGNINDAIKELMEINPELLRGDNVNLDTIGEDARQAVFEMDNLEEKVDEKVESIAQRIFKKYGIVHDKIKDYVRVQICASAFKYNKLANGVRSFGNSLKEKGMGIIVYIIGAGKMPKSATKRFIKNVALHLPNPQKAFGSILGKTSGIKAALNIQENMSDTGNSGDNILQDFQNRFILLQNMKTNAIDYISPLFTSFINSLSDSLKKKGDTLSWAGSKALDGLSYVIKQLCDSIISGYSRTSNFIRSTLIPKARRMLSYAVKGVTTVMGKAWGRVLKPIKDGILKILGVIATAGMKAGRDTWNCIIYEVLPMLCSGVAAGFRALGWGTVEVGNFLGNCLFYFGVFMFESVKAIWPHIKDGFLTGLKTGVALVGAILGFLLILGIYGCKYGKKFGIFLKDVVLPWILEKARELGYIGYEEGAKLLKSISSMIATSVANGARKTADAIGRACNHFWISTFPWLKDLGKDLAYASASGLGMFAGGAWTVVTCMFRMIFSGLYNYGGPAISFVLGMGLRGVANGVSGAFGIIRVLLLGLCELAGGFWTGEDELLHYSEAGQDDQGAVESVRSRSRRSAPIRSEFGANSRYGQVGQTRGQSKRPWMKGGGKKTKKRNKIIRNKAKRNKTKRTKAKRNKTKRNKTKKN